MFNLECQSDYQIYHGKVGYISILVSDPSGNPNIHEAVAYKSSPGDRAGIRQDEQTDYESND
jgi:hypothetical protein